MRRRGDGMGWDCDGWMSMCQRGLELAERWVE